MDKFQQSQKNQLFKTPAHDPYCLPKIEGSAVCPQCGAAYQAGNWTWKVPENTVVHDAQSVTCPACQRTNDNKPAVRSRYRAASWPRIEARSST